MQPDADPRKGHGSYAETKRQRDAIWRKAKKPR
jgi:hypothetical protein